MHCPSDAIKRTSVPLAHLTLREVSLSLSGALAPISVSVTLRPYFAAIKRFFLNGADGRECFSLIPHQVTGMRASELRGLRKDHIQLNNLRIIKVRQRADENGIIGRVKTGSSNRDIIIPEALVTVLKGWLIECPVGDLAFPNWVGNVESHANITNRCWKPILERAEIKTHYTPHALRHFHASMLIASGATPKEVMVEMGHSSIQTTFDIYGHLFPEDDEHRRHRAEVMASSLI